MTTAPKAVDQEKKELEEAKGWEETAVQLTTDAVGLRKELAEARAEAESARQGWEKCEDKLAAFKSHDRCNAGMRSRIKTLEAQVAAEKESFRKFDDVCMARELALVSENAALAAKVKEQLREKNHYISEFSTARALVETLDAALASANARAAELEIIVGYAAAVKLRDNTEEWAQGLMDKIEAYDAKHPPAPAHGKSANHDLVENNHQAKTAAKLCPWCDQPRPKPDRWADKIKFTEPAPSPCRRSETGWCWTHDKMCCPPPPVAQKEPCRCGNLIDRTLLPTGDKCQECVI